MSLVLTTETNPGTAVWGSGNLFGYPWLWYGSGKDGAALLNSGTEVSFNFPQEYTTLTVAPGGDPVTNTDVEGLPFGTSYLELSATESISISNSLVCAQGGQPDNSVAGAGGEDGTAGADGTIANGASVTESTVPNMTNTAGFGYRTNGGDGGSGDGGATSGGDGFAPLTLDVPYFSPFRAMVLHGGQAYKVAVGGYGGGGGGGDGVNAGGDGGAGGGGGGAVVLRSPTITLTNVVFNVSGGDGNDGDDGSGGDAGGGGGGGGGNGGLVIFIAETLTRTNVTFTVDGGTGGAGGNGVGSGASGNPGSDGADGEVWWYQPSTNTWTNLLL
jgi:hypothetical protein